MDRVSVTSFFELIKKDSAPGVTGLPMKVLIKIFPVICEPLTEYFNDCLNENLFPDEWKCAIVTTIFKGKGSRSDVNNYRGISVLSPISKLFEKCIASQIFDYFESNNLFFIGQHGFRKNFSCETALH